MAFCSYSKEYSATSFTDIDNMFIFEYMPEATGNAVKVYVYGLFLCKNSEFNVTAQDFADSLKLSEGEVKDAFSYWEEFGLVSIISEQPFEVIYHPFTSTAKPRKIKAEKYTAFSNSLQALIPSRMISTAEFSEYFNIMEVYKIKPEAMLMIVKYCVDLKGESIGYRYVSAVAKDFGSRKILTANQVETELSSYVRRTGEIDRILSAMSLKKKPEIEDLNYLNKWTEELGFETDNIVFAAGKIKKGSMKKLDEFICELYSSKKFSRSEIESYTKDKQNIFDLTVKINKALSVYYDVLDTVVENYTSVWCSMGYDEKSLLLIANYCFKRNTQNKLETMDSTVKALHLKGIISYESITDYFMQLAKTDGFISTILTELGITRKPTVWDRENFNRWANWNFSEEMITEAAKLAVGKASPIPYMNAILGTWKQKGIFDKAQITVDDKSTNSFGNERSYTKEELEKVIDDIADIEF